MAGQSTNSANIARVKRGASNNTSLVVHPEFEYWLPDWVKVRDALAGQREVKAKSTVYLRKHTGFDSKEYQQFLAGAVFFNMTAQTLSGMTGQVFRRAPVIRGLPNRLKPVIANGVGKDGSSHIAFAKTVVAEQCALGRYGVLVDAPKSSADSYMTGYVAENIVDWLFEDIDGKQVLTRVLLREWSRNDQPAPRSGAWPYVYTARYRELVLAPHDDSDLTHGLRYEQRIYREDPGGAPSETLVPLINGRPLEFIPFVFFGVTGNIPDCEKPPILDIVEINLSHYNTYADLEWGRKFTGLPVYYAPTSPGTGAGNYHIGPSMVWEVPPDSQPGIIEYKGEGLKALERALQTKEAQIAAIGGRLLPGMGQGVSESENQSALREASEQSILLNVILAAQDGLSLCFRYWAMWRNLPFSQSWELRYDINTDFLTGAIGAREMRAIQQMYEAGLIPVEVLYDFLRKCEVIPESMELDEFKALLDDPESFKNMPDVLARQRGYQTRAQELEDAARKQELGHAEREIVLEEEKLEIASAVGSTSVAASRKLGDPEQAKPARENPKPATPPPQVGPRPPPRSPF